MLITGAALLNNTLAGLLALCPATARVVLVGPTVGLSPEPLLRRGVDLLGGMRVTVPADFLDTIIAEGGSGAQFFGRSAEKIELQRRRAG